MVSAVQGVQAGATWITWGDSSSAGKGSWRPEHGEERGEGKKTKPQHSMLAGLSGMYTYPRMT